MFESSNCKICENRKVFRWKEIPLKSPRPCSLYVSTHIPWFNPNQSIKMQLSLSPVWWKCFFTVPWGLSIMRWKQSDKMQTPSCRLIKYIRMVHPFPSFFKQIFIECQSGMHCCMLKGWCSSSEQNRQKFLFCRKCTSVGSKNKRKTKIHNEAHERVLAAMEEWCKRTCSFRYGRKGEVQPRVQKVRRGNQCGHIEGSTLHKKGITNAMSLR